MTGMTIEIEAPPIPLKRPRAAKTGFYDPQYQAKKNFAFEVLSKITNKNLPIDSPIKLKLDFYFKIRKSWSKKKQKALLNQHHFSTPDLSNLIKFIEDALNNVIWKDDSLICEITASKKWCEFNKTIINVLSM